MPKYIITEIDQNVNGDKDLTPKVAMTAVRYWIKRNVDNTFPREQFEEWVNSDTESPFRWNGNSYYWA